MLNNVVQTVTKDLIHEFSLKNNDKNFYQKYVLYLKLKHYFHIKSIYYLDFNIKIINIQHEILFYYK